MEMAERSVGLEGHMSGIQSWNCNSDGGKVSNHP